MNKFIKAGLLIGMAASANLYAISDLRPLSPNQETLRSDLQEILKKGNLIGKVDFRLSNGSQNEARIVCDANKVLIDIKGDHQWGQTFYMSLQRLGFLFPHPRIQITPTISKIRSQCDKTFAWKPALKYHGFHFHTQHPSEWVEGFLNGKTQMALDTVTWLARNQQNIFDLALLRQNKTQLFNNLKVPFALAKKFGIHAGVSLGIALQQQNSYKLVGLAAALFDKPSAKEIDKNLKELLNNVDVSFVNLEMGTSEFTPSSYKRTINWMNQAATIAKSFGVETVIKVHVSTNQSKPEYGNFNFLPQYAIPEVGILPHTVYFYGLGDDEAPMYGNKDFKHILEFMLKEKDKRRAWFYPETSYYIALDIDAPLLLTDYLITRANDTRILYDNHVEGQINFTTGQEHGYWLIDWTYALMNNRDYDFDPLTGLKLLGEDEDSWSRILKFQNEYFKDKKLISIITFQNFGDEIIPNTHHILERNMLKTLNKNRPLLKQEIDRLKDAIAHIPEKLVIRNKELRLMMEVTFLRLHHALKTREAFYDEARKNEFLASAVQIRAEAQKRIDEVIKNQRYPEAKTYEKHKNLTAYPHGYGYTIKNLHYWKREEEMIRRKNFSPFFMNITNFLDIIF